MAKEKRERLGKLAAIRRGKGVANPDSMIRGPGGSGGVRRPAKKLTAFIKVFAAEEGRDRVYPLDRKEEYVIGRTSDADIPLADRKVSRKHCKIVRRGDRYIIVDLGSRNGTFLSGKKVRRHLLKDGDQIQVGMSRLLFFKAEKTEVVIERAKEHRCELCGGVVSQSDILSGKAEEVDGSYFCPACVAQVMGEEVVSGVTPAGLTPPAEDVTVRMTPEEVKAAQGAAKEEKGVPARPRGGVKPSQPPPPSEETRRAAVRDRLREAARTKPQPQEPSPELPDFSFEDVSTMKRPSPGKKVDETTYDEEVAGLAALSEPPQIDNLSVFEEADVDSLIDELLEEEGE